MKHTQAPDFPNWSRYEKCPICNAWVGRPCRAIRKTCQYQIDDVVTWPHQKRKVRLLIRGGLPARKPGDPREWRCLVASPAKSGMATVQCTRRRSHPHPEHFNRATGRSWPKYNGGLTR